MPCYYIHIRAAGLMMERLKAGVPAGSPLTQEKANALFEAAHQNCNYFAAGVYGPDLFFLLPDFMGDTGKMLSAIVDFGQHSGERHQRRHARRSISGALRVQRQF